MTTAEKKLAQQSLSLFELAEALGSVPEACRRRGISRTRFYEYKRRFQTHGIEGLKDLPPIPKSHPMTTPGPVVQQVLEMVLEHPAWGCNRVSDWLKLQGVSISPPTVQKIWNEQGLGSGYDCWLALERHVAEHPLAVTAEQVRFLEKQNSQWKERHVGSSRPGELLCQDTFFVGHFKGVGKVYYRRSWIPSAATPLPQRCSGSCLRVHPADCSGCAWHFPIGGQPSPSSATLISSRTQYILLHLHLPP